MELGLYFHIPFCERKCPYCDFYSIPIRTGLAENYVDRLCDNITYYGEQKHHTTPLCVDTIYFGGGTPSLLTPSQIERILRTCQKSFSLDTNLEITLECNPRNATRNYCTALSSLGVNRLSLGIQSLDEGELIRLGRLHTPCEAIKAIQTSFASGIENLSVDLIVAYPKQTKELLSSTLAKLRHLPLSHCSAYLLQVEDGTPLSHNATLLESLPDEDLTAELYYLLCDSLGEMGLQQYEISSFSKPEKKSRHNQKYWHCDPYLGIGSGSHSCFGGKRFFFQKDVHAFLAFSPQEEILLDSCPCQIEERLSLGLRLCEGIPLSFLSQRAKVYAKSLARCDYVHLTEERIALTPKGFLVSNAIIARLLD